MDECNLDANNADGRHWGWVKVRLEDELVYVVGYGEKVPLRYDEALCLLHWLRQHEALLTDRVQNFYECRECGGLHPRSIQLCPLLMQASYD